MDKDISSLLYKFEYEVNEFITQHTDEDDLNVIVLNKYKYLVRFYLEIKGYSFAIQALKLFKEYISEHYKLYEIKHLNLLLYYLQAEFLGETQHV